MFMVECGILHKSGVMQGAGLSPMLFAITINKIEVMISLIPLLEFERNTRKALDSSLIELKYGIFVVSYV